MSDAQRGHFERRESDDEALVERVAQAIHAARYIEYVTPDGDYSFTEADSRTLAQAAINAMKADQ